MRMKVSDPDQQNFDFEFYALLRFRALAMAMLGMYFIVRSSFPGLPSGIHLILEYPAVKIPVFLSIVTSIVIHLVLTSYVLTKVGVWTFFLKPQFTKKNLMPFVQVALFILTLELLLLISQLLS